MNRQVLADRIISYSDAIVAFALVNGFAFVISLGDPDIRCSIARVSGVAIAMNLIFPIASSYALVWLRDFERRLRGGANGEGESRGRDSGDRTAAAESDSKIDPSRAVSNVADELVSRFWRIAFLVRIALIWFFAVVVIVGIVGATRDVHCVVSVG